MSKLSLAFLLAITVTGCATHPSAAPSPTTRQESNLAVARKLYADFVKGDIDSVLGAMSDDVVWEIAGPANVPYAGVRHGKKEWMAYLAGLGAVELLAFEPTEFLADKDKVVVIGSERLKVKSNGRVIDEQFAQVITFAGGKVVHFRSYDDSAASAAAFKAVP
jgi:ketosteroid isomerase-like protein